MRNRGAQRQQERWKRPGCRPIVRLAEERDAPPSDDAAHLEVRKRDVGIASSRTRSSASVMKFSR